MKSEHRHELKTNELAEWLTHLPQWTKDNLLTVIIVLVVIAAATAFYLWRALNERMLARKQFRLTTLVSQLGQSKMQILNQGTQGRDLSYILLEPAGALKGFADEAGDGAMAALALIKRAEALRMELHYRKGAISRDDLESQTNQAKESYAAAVEKASSSPSLKAKARFGLGLCEEELGNLAEARRIYGDIAGDSSFDGTVAAAQARHRLKTMAEYSQKIALKPAPRPKPIDLTKLLKQDQTGEPNMPFDANAATVVRPPVDANVPVEANVPTAIKRPVDANAPVDANVPRVLKPPVDANASAPAVEPVVVSPPADANQQPAPVNVPAPAEANQAGQTPGAAKVTDVDVPGE
ncbi:MAG: hypothetical protein JSU94_09400 [Phycisphaerales bacterium]|nr:MAG: hypothetical protein JSU94_09400 [Phycisphaerales bacterium]